MFTLETTATAAYVVAALLFILALAGRCRSGNRSDRRALVGWLPLFLRVVR